MKKRPFLKRLQYWFDRMMSKGPIAMSLLLFSVTATIICMIGVIAFLVSGKNTVLVEIWNSLQYTLDAGNLSGVDTDNIAYLFLMFLATLCGLFLTSVLIGIISTGVESKLRDLRKGRSVVQEQDHTVIIGFDNNVYTLLRELIEANANHKNSCIVILGEESNETMDEAIAAHIPNTGTTHIICRSGKLHELYSLERCSVETARSVIVNLQNDAETVKTILALATYIKGKELRHPNLPFVVSLQDESYVESAEIAGEGHTSRIFAQEAIARIIANTCRQHGLSQVLTELFNFSGNELYFEPTPAALVGKTFREAMLCLPDAILTGLQTGNKVTLNPPMDTVIREYDQLILLEADDGAYHCHAPAPFEEDMIRNIAGNAARDVGHLVVLGSNEKLPSVLREYAQYVESGTRVIIVDNDINPEALGHYENLDISICTRPVTRKLLCELLDQKHNNILLLNDNSTDPETSDSQTLLRLILLRDIADNSNKHFSITTEMRSSDNQRLASQARVDDFVIGSNFTSLLLAQISENPEMRSLILELLDESGSELYMKPAADYVVIGQPVDSYTLTESVARKGEVYVGYRHLNGKEKTNVVVNPNKAEKILFGENDQLVVIAEN